MVSKMLPLIASYKKWKVDIAIFEEYEPGKHLSMAPFFERMFTEFIIGPHDGEGAGNHITIFK